MSWRRLALVATLVAAAVACGASAASAAVLRVGTWNGTAGDYTSIQDAVNHASPGDWILVGPGDYKEQGYAGMAEPAGVLITTPNIHLRGMDRNTVVVDGTKRRASQCSNKPNDQGQLDRNGIEVYKANNTWIENLTVCNFLDKNGEGEQIWWNGGDGSGQLGLTGFWGNYLTATSSYSSSVAGALGPCCGVNYPAGDYGIFSSNATNGWFKNSYANNMADAAYYIGACQQQCSQTMQYDKGENSSLCLSSTNAGGYLLVANNECDNNKTGLASNSQNNDDWPSPQIGSCPPGQTGPLPKVTKSCTVWMNNNIHDNNNPNVPGNGSGLSGGAPVGTGLILAGSTYDTLYGNTVKHQGAWGELIADLPDQEAPAANNPNPCSGGTWAAAAETCYYNAYGNISENNKFSKNGFFGNPTNGDVGLATQPHHPGNCFSGDSTPDGTDPAGIETNPAYQPTSGMCQKDNGGDMGMLAAQIACAGQIFGPCPSTLVTNYPHPAQQFPLPPVPSNLPTMANPCKGVPSNPWCS